MDTLTQTVEVRAFASDEELNSAMQQKLEGIYAEILRSEPVATAFTAYEAARDEVARLRAAQAGLTLRARSAFEALKRAAAAVDTALVDDAKCDVNARTKALVLLEAEHRSVSRANSRIVEHLLPRAEIAALDRTADHLSAKAYALREAANQRIQRTAQMMAQAAEYEGGIVFDSLNTLSGEMRRQAAEFDREAANNRSWAREREEQYQKLARELESVR